LKPFNCRKKSKSPPVSYPACKKHNYELRNAFSKTCPFTRLSDSLSISSKPYPYIFGIVRAPCAFTYTWHSLPACRMRQIRPSQFSARGWLSLGTHCMPRNPSKTINTRSSSPGKPILGDFLPVIFREMQVQGRYKLFWPGY
jgi:hypothetical protein